MCDGHFGHGPERASGKRARSVPTSRPVFTDDFREEGFPGIGNMSWLARTLRLKVRTTDMRQQCELRSAKVWTTFHLSPLPMRNRQTLGD